MTVSFSEICEGIETTLATASGIKSTKSYDEITEAVPALACPRLHVYPKSLVNDIRTQTDRTAFVAGLQQMELIVYVDHFARQRSHIDQDLTATIEGLESLTEVLQSQERPPFFGVPGIKAFSWTWDMSTLRYGDSFYVGGRFTLKLRIY